MASSRKRDRWASSDSSDSNSCDDDDDGKGGGRYDADVVAKDVHGASKRERKRKKKKSRRRRQRDEEKREHDDTNDAKKRKSESCDGIQLRPTENDHHVNLSSSRDVRVPNSTVAFLSGGSSTPDGERRRSHEPLFDGCRSVTVYKRLNRIQEGTYGVVTRAKCDRTGDVVALKAVKMGKREGKEGFPITAIREINVLLALRHPNIIRVREMVVGGSSRSVYMVMDYMEHDLKTLMSRMKHSFSQSEVKCLLRQLLSAVEFMHRHWYLHRDLKTSNLLYGNDGILRVCDFGLARKYGDPLQKYTQPVVTLWYRAPELLLGSEYYSTPVDMWSVGCIFAEMLTLDPLFSAKTEVEQIKVIYRLLGSPNEKRWPGYSQLPIVRQVHFGTWPRNRLREMFPRTSLTGGFYLSDLGLDLLSGMLGYDPESRTTAASALAHGYFDESPLPRDVVLMPTYAATNEGHA